MPDTKITITFINFLKSLINNAKKVNGIANVNPSLSGITDPKIIPINVVISQIVQHVTPAPNK